jgi:hypothetical protein
MYEDFVKKEAQKKRYFYCAVSGASLWYTGSFKEALRAVHRLRKGTFTAWPNEQKNAEVERGLNVGFNGHAYWRWRNGEWSKRTWVEATEEDLARWREKKSKEQ